MSVLVFPWSCVMHDNHRLMPARGRLITSPVYRNAKAFAVMVAIGGWRGRKPLSGDVVLVADCWFPDKRKRDAGNYRKLITDALSGIVYDDDAQLVREVWERAGYDKAEPRIIVTVQEKAA